MKVTLQLTVALYLLVMGFSQMLQAGLINQVREASSNRVQCHIRVVDEAGSPLPGAAIWSTDRLDEGDYDWLAVMWRLYERYGGEYDYARSLDLLPGRVVRDYADAQGEFTWSWETDKTPLMVFAALKRGYQAKAVQIQTRRNDEQELVISLRRNPDEVVDPRMEEFDRLRGEIFNTEALDRMSIERADYITDRVSAIRRIAESLEVDAPALAARVYMNLSDMPAVILVQNQEGKITGRGFVNGYTPDNPERVADREKAFELDNESTYLNFYRKSNPNALKDFLSYPKEEQDRVRRENLEKIENVMESSPDRVWPILYMSVFNGYLGLKDFEKACKALHRAYDFEPAAHSQADWREYLLKLQRHADKSGVSIDCHVLGIS